MHISSRPPALGRRHMVSSTHYLATEAGLRLFDRGGNAVDAGVAAGIALGVLERNYVDFGGIAPIIIHGPGMESPEAYDGVGRWPLSSTLDSYIGRYGGEMPQGIPRAVVPGAPDAWLTALARHGTLSLSDVLQPAIELAHGFPMSRRLAADLAVDHHFYRDWPSSTAVFLPDGAFPEPGDVFVQSDLANLLERLVAAERASEGSREDRIMSARDEFYRGDIAEQIARFVHEQGGELSLRDLAEHAVAIGPTATSTYRGVEIHASGAYSQGPVVPMVLNLLEHLTLADSDPHDPEVLHALISSVELAFADREGFFGDPEHVDVPLEGLLSKAYADERWALVTERRTTTGLPAPGNPWRHEGREGPAGYVTPPANGERSPDTSYVAVMDADGLAFSATPSDGATLGPLVPGLGIVVSPRGSQLRLDPAHPSAIAPGKRPRITPNPAMVLEKGRAIIAFGCPGADAQTQGMIQAISHIIDRRMDLQSAVETGRVVTYSAPDSFHPHRARPGVVGVEATIPDTAKASLAERGHTVEDLPALSKEVSAVCAVRLHANGVLEGGADPRRDSLAQGW